MLFNSIAFLIFFPTVCFIYYLIPWVKYRNWFLLVASYYFYMNWEPVYALLLLSSTAITYFAAKGISSAKTQKQKHTYLVLSVTLNILILFFFKYYAFAAENISTLLDVLGISIHFPSFDILLPVGISFYIFQALGYSIDVYRGDVKAERNYFTYALFVSFFPQLVAGPIERSTNLLPQFYKNHHFDYDRAMAGLKIMLWGYFLKLVIADRCAIYVDAVFNNLDSHEGHSTLIAAVLFCFQIYGDFAGYTYIAIGAAKIMGFNLIDNFKRPYFATSISEFWKRWHMSLTKWFTSYLYIPLGGNRCSKWRHSLNVLTTFLVSGLWHGANYTFIVWGGIHGSLLVFEKQLGIHKKQPRGFNRVICVLTTFIVVCFAWVFFRANSMHDAFTALGLMFNPVDLQLSSKRYDLALIGCAIIVLFLKEMFDENSYSIQKEQIQSYFHNTVWMTLLLVLIAWFGVFDGGEFIYFQF